MPRRLDRARPVPQRVLPGIHSRSSAAGRFRTSRIVMQPSTGQTRLHMLQPTHVSSLIVKTLTMPPPAPGTTSHPPEWRSRAVPHAIGRQVIGRRAPVPSDRLVAAVLAGDVAEPAVDALVLVDPGDDLVVQVELAPRLDPRHRAADDVADRLEALLAHPAFEAARQVLDDPESVMHDGRADLHRARAQQEELDGVLPGLDAADAADRHLDRRDRPRPRRPC